MSKVVIKKVPGYSDYAVTTDGQLISYKKGKETVINGYSASGYCNVSISDAAGVTKSFQLHRLVAITFLKNPNKHPIVNHKDGDKLNNKLSNLEWTSHRGNTLHGTRILEPKKKAARQEKQLSDFQTRLSIINHAQSACVSNPELFHTIVAATLQDLKL
jgi:hypothetical protein